MACRLLVASRVSGTSTRLVALALALVGCEHGPKDKGPPKEPPPPPASEDTIHVGPVEGKLNGEPFTVKTARYVVDSRRGFEKVDLQLIDAEATTGCGPLSADKPARVWLRRVGPGALTAQTASGTVADAGLWEVHYQAVEDGRWMGRSEANYLLSLQDPGPDLKLKGTLWACFRDAPGSCVQGEFSATFCTPSIDEPVRGTAAMERPKAYLLAHDGGVHRDGGAP